MDLVYQAFDKFILRTHIYPLDYLKIFQTRELKVKEIIKIISDPIFQEAIYISSPSLYSEIDKILNHGNSNKKELERIHQSIIKYFIRMSSRCTPFGLMASCTTGTIDAQTNMELEPYIKWKRRTFLGMDFISKFIKQLENEHKILSRIKFFPNSSLYFLNNNVRLIEYQYINSIRKKYQIVSFKSSEVLEKIIFKSKNGCTLNELATEIVDSEITIRDALTFVKELISNQILVSELEPCISRINPFAWLSKKISNITIQSNTLKSINEYSEILKKLDSRGIGQSISQYEYLFKTNLEKNIGVNYLFNINLISKSKKCTLSSSIIQRVQKVIQIIQKCDYSIPNENLNEFKKEFIERFEDREIPLTLVLDAEAGIQYGRSADFFNDERIIKGLTYRDRKENRKICLISPFIEYLINRLSKALLFGHQEISLLEDDLKNVKQTIPQQEYTPTITACISLYPGLNEDSEIIQLSWFGGPASKTFARFGHSDLRIKKLIQDIVKFEKKYYKDKIIAEIIHIPDDRIGNILLRPRTYEYEIPYMAFSNLPISNQININDLFISVTGNRIILKSKRLNKEILPCLTSAHNYMLSSLPIYKFLCDFQYQDLLKGYALTFGEYLGELFLFVPRITLEGIIISPATWNIDCKDIENFFTIKDDSLLFSKVDEWRNKIKLPERVKLVESDNELIIFFNNIQNIKMFLSMIKNRHRIKLCEILFDLNKDNTVFNKNGSYNNEILLAFYKK